MTRAQKSVSFPPMKRHPIRIATVDDAAAIAAVHLYSRQTVYLGLLPDHILENETIEQFTWNWESWLAFPNSLAARTWLIEENKETIGFVGTGPNRDGEDANAVAELYGINILPEQWRRGIGRELLDHALEDLRERGFKSLTLWVLEGNLIARRFYQKLGFEPDGETRIELQGNIELTEMRYRLEL